MFDLFPQQNFCDMLKSTAFMNSAYRGGKTTTLAAIKTLESARVWDASTFAQAIDQVQPGAIWIAPGGIVHVDGGPSTLTRIVDAYLELTGQPVREVL